MNTAQLNILLDLLELENKKLHGNVAGVTAGNGELPAVFPTLPKILKCALHYPKYSSVPYTFQKNSSVPYTIQNTQVWECTTCAYTRITIPEHKSNIF